MLLGPKLHASRRGNYNPPPIWLAIVIAAAIFGAAVLADYLLSH